MTALCRVIPGFGTVDSMLRVIGGLLAFLLTNTPGAQDLAHVRFGNPALENLEGDTDSKTVSFYGTIKKRVTHGRWYFLDKCLQAIGFQQSDGVVDAESARANFSEDHIIYFEDYDHHQMRIGKGNDKCPDGVTATSKSPCLFVRIRDQICAFADLSCVNRPPIANAGPDQTVQVGSPVQLDGSGSTDPDGDTLKYTWKLISKPSGSKTKLSKTNIPKPTFKADKVGDYVLELKVDDGRGGTATDQVKITATTIINLFKEDFEGDISGWTFTSFWHVQDNPQLVTNAYQGGCVTLPDDAHLPSATSGSKALWYGQATDGSFVGPNPDTASPGCTSSQANSGTALSPMVDLTTASAASLKFQSWFEIESVDADRFDLMKIEILNVVSDEVLGCYLLNPPEDVNGPDNQPFTSGGFNSPAQWVQQSVDLTPFIGQKVRFRFTFDTRDRLYNGFRGWLIDDVVVSNQTAPTSSTLRACPLLGSASSDPRGLSGKDTIKNPSFNLSIKFGTVQFMADGQGIQEIQVQVFNLAGREVYNSGFVTGSKLYWNGLTNDGRRLANGVYLYVVRVRGFDGREYVSEVRKLAIVH